MRKASLLALLLVCGCSTAPLAGFLDLFFPGPKADTQVIGPNRPDAPPPTPPRDPLLATPSDATPAPRARPLGDPVPLPPTPPPADPVPTVPSGQKT